MIAPLGLSVVLVIGLALVRLCWRWRTGLSVLVVVFVGLPMLWDATADLVEALSGVTLAPMIAPLPVAVVLAGVLAWPRPRRWVWARLGCARTRRRVRAVLWQTHVPDSRDRLPVVRRVRPTPVGERLQLTVRPGQSAELVAAHIPALRAGARARDVTVSRDPRRADRVYVDVIRRDLLDSQAPLRSPLLARAAHLAPIPRPESGLGTAVAGVSEPEGSDR